MASTEEAKSLKIYVAGPYTAQEYKHIHDVPMIAQKNVNKACDVALQLLNKGHTPYIPHMTHYLFVFHKGWDNLSHDDWVLFDDPWVESCDALYYIAPSSGADRELERAKRLGKKIFYSMEEVPEAGK